MHDERLTFWDRCIKDPAGKIALKQRPNLPAIVGLATIFLAFPLAGSAQQIVLDVSIGAWVAWALLELFYGVNYFRRGLGVIALMVLAVLVV